MGLTTKSVGIKAVDPGIDIKKRNEDDLIIALAGNPNVGKSTVFNNLTGMKQHTGNWPGKTVVKAQGYCSYKNKNFVMVDLPGTYSLMAHSVEEEVARDFICFGENDAVIVVCDATCLERNFNLVLQTIEITDNVIVCVNLMDEAKKKNINIDLDSLSKKLGVSVIGTTARKKQSLNLLLENLVDLTQNKNAKNPVKINYSKLVQEAINIIKPVIKKKNIKNIKTDWLCIKLLDYNEKLITTLNNYLEYDITKDKILKEKLKKAQNFLLENGISNKELSDIITTDIIHTAEKICADTVKYEKLNYNERDKKIDKILTNRWTGIPIMIALLAVVFWLTITGANYPSQMLAKGLFWFQDRLTDLFMFLGSPMWLHDMLVLGVYRVLAWVVSVMLPPMAIFFPLFTLLEDLGYLPRIAFNLDKSFKRCSACGKQALTMCMGFGCNAAGIIGCRIIDSPRERLIAMITNNFVPCNGRFPTLIAIISMFLVGSIAIGLLGTVCSALILTSIILLGIIMTFGVSKFLSKTFLKGVPSSFTLELPPYRKPQIGKVIVRSIYDRTLFVLGRAIIVAAPAGLVIWVMANVSIGNVTILAHCSNFLDPFANLMGLDGVILLAFILGLPANEIVVPLIIMGYMSTGNIVELESLTALKELFVNNGWTIVTAISTMLFSLMHWPCSTTLITIKKETQSTKWTLVSFIIPTIIGIICCMVFANIARIFI